MRFPWDVTIGSLHVSSHMVFETAAYTIGFLVYRRARARAGDTLNDDQRWTIIVAAAMGAWLGAKSLHVLNEWNTFRTVGWRMLVLPGGKTLVGGILGGWAVVEWVKARRGIVTRTGDLFAVPLAIAIAVGRIGCFSAGLDDHTTGTPTALFSGIDFGDGVRRHPTALYEAFFAILLAVALTFYARRKGPPGRVFNAFILAYGAFRLGVDFLKPYDRVLGLCAIQWAALAGLIVAACRRFPETPIVREKT